jgi:pilus assembly protein CpaB
MNSKTIIPIAVALVLGLAAALVAQRFLRARAEAAKPNMVSVVVAKVPVAPGQSLSAENLEKASILGKEPPLLSFTNPADLVGRVTAVPILSGQAILQTLLAPKGTIPGLQALVSPGLRAVTVDVSESGGMAGLLLPGSRVDVVATNLGRDNHEKTITRTIVQNLPVVAVGQRLTSSRGESEKDGAAKTVTLLASPHDAETLDLAMATSRVRLVLRASNDTEETIDDGVMLAELRGEDGYQPPAPVTTPAVASQPVAPPATTQPDVFAVKAPEPPPAPPRMITVILGAEERHVTFTDPPPDSNKAVTDANSQQPAIPQ